MMILHGWFKNWVETVFTSSSRRRRGMISGVSAASAEVLELRALLAATALDAGVLTIDIDNIGETVTIVNDGATIQLSSSMPADSNAPIGGSGATFATDAVTQLIIADSGGLGEQVLVFGVGTELTLPGGLSIAGVESVRFQNAVTATGTSTIDVTAVDDIIVEADLTAGTGGLSLTGLGTGSATDAGIRVSGDVVVTATGMGSVVLNGTGTMGVRIQAGTVTSAGGDVSVTGRGHNNGIGVWLEGGTIASSGSGATTVSGMAVSQHGVVVSQESTIASQGSGAVDIIGDGWTGVFLRGTVTTGGGDVTISGQGGEVVGGPEQATLYNRGVNMDDGVISSGGDGSIAITGFGGGTVDSQGNPSNGSDNGGIRLTNTTITSGGMGDVTISGTGGSASDGSNQGVLIFRGSITTGGGDVHLSGHGGNAVRGSSNDGVEIDAPVTTGGDGSVTIEGTGGESSFGFNHGVLIHSGPVSSGGAGDVTIIGVGGNGSGNDNNGVLLNPLRQITSGGGNVTVTGTGGGGSGNGTGNDGVEVQGQAEITSGGGTVTVTGYGGGGGTGGDNHGVRLLSTKISTDFTVPVITSGGGDVRVDGVGGAGSAGSNLGVDIQRTGKISAGGSGTVTVSGTGGRGTGNQNDGVRISEQGSIITSSGGNVSVTGQGGGEAGSASTGNRGVLVVGEAEITAGGSGNVTVSGTGGEGSGMEHHGVLVDGVASRITSAGGEVSVTADGNGVSDSLRLRDSGSIVSSNHPITIVTDSLNTEGILNSGGSTSATSKISSGTAATTIRTLTDGTAINLGGTDVINGSTSVLGLSATELEAVTAGSLIFEHNAATASGDIVVSDAIVRTTPTDIQLLTNGNVILDTGSIDTGSGTLAIRSGPSPSAIRPNMSDIDATASNLTLGGAVAVDISGATPDIGYTQLNVAGPVDLNGATLSLGGRFAGLTGTEVFTIVAASRVTGTFAGLEQGTQVDVQGTPFLVSYTSTSVQLVASILTVTIDAVSIDEDGGTATGTVTRATTGAASGDVVVALTSNNPSRATVPTSVTIPDGQNSAEFTITAVNNELGDGTEAVTVTASAPGLSPATETVDVVDDEVSVNVSLSHAQANEASETQVTITATVSEPVVGDQTVDVVVSGTDITASDYTLSATTITITDGNTTGTALLTVLSDDVPESTIETAIVNLMNPSSGMIPGNASSAELTIADLAQIELNPVDRYPGAQPQLSWQGVPGAVSYEVWFARIFPTMSRLHLTSGLTDTNWTPPDTLDSAYYRYWVRPFYEGNTAGQWSQADSFEVRPTLIGPLTGTFSDQPTFEWNVIPHAGSYQLYLQTSSGVQVVDDITGTSYTPETRLSEGRVRWWVRAMESTGNRGWSDVGVTGVLPYTTVTGPASGPDNTPTITWNAVPGAGRYILHVVRLSDNEVVIRHNFLGSNEYNESPALAAENYRVWVKALNASGNFDSGRWSSAFDFTITSVDLQDLDESRDSSDLHITTLVSLLGLSRFDAPTTNLPDRSEERPAPKIADVEARMIFGCKDGGDLVKSVEDFAPSKTSSSSSKSDFRVLSQRPTLANFSTMCSRPFGSEDLRIPSQ